MAQARECESVSSGDESGVGKKSVDLKNIQEIKLTRHDGVWILGEGMTKYKMFQTYTNYFHGLCCFYYHIHSTNNYANSYPIFVK